MNIILLVTKYVHNYANRTQTIVRNHVTVVLCSYNNSFLFNCQYFWNYSRLNQIPQKWTFGKWSI